MPKTIGYVQGIPVIVPDDWETRTLGPDFINIPPERGLKQLMEIPESPLNEYNFLAYRLSEVGMKFFNKVFPRKLPDDDILLYDIDGLFGNIYANSASVFLKNKNTETVAIKIHIFTSNTESQIIKAHKASKDVIGSNEVGIFVYTPINGSKARLLVSAGNNAQDYINILLQIKRVTNWLNAEYAIETEEFKKVVNDSFSKFNLFEGLAKALGITIELVGELFEFIGNAFEKLGKLIEEAKIKDETWKVKVPTNTALQQDITKLIDKSIDDFIGKWKNNLPQFVQEGITILKAIIAKAISSAIANIKNFDSNKISFALLCGVINGLVDIIAGFFIFIGMLFKAAAELFKAGGSVIQNMAYYTDLFYAYLREFSQSIAAINWEKVITSIMQSRNAFSVDNIVAAINAINFTIYDAAYYVGYIGINVVVCFIPVANLVQLQKLQKIAEPLVKLFSTLAEIGGKVGKVFKNKLDDVIETIGNFLELLQKGTEGVIEFIKRVLIAIQKWVDELLRVKKLRMGTKIDELVIALEKLDKFDNWLVQSFKNGKYLTVEAKNELILYRDFGDKAFLNGGFSTTIRNATRESLALHESFGNSMRFKATIKVPPKTKLNIGKVGEYPPEAIDALQGGADQVLLPLNYDINWIEKVYDNQTKKIYTLKEFIKAFPELIK